MWNNFYLVKTLEEALELLSQHGADARIIAGGTDIILELERNGRPGVKTLIDISRVPGLDNISIDQDHWIHIGPLITHNDCVASSLIQQRARLLSQTCWEVGAPQIRNRATVAGNLITASPANDTITPLIALKAQVTLRSMRGERKVPLSEFYNGVRKTVMTPDELMTNISFKALNENERSMFVKLGLRKFQAIAVVNVAVILGIEEQDGKMVGQDTRIAMGAVGPTIIRATAAENHLNGHVLDEASIETAARLTAQAARPIDDIRGTAEYRTGMVRVLTHRALLSILEDKTHGWIPDKPVMLSGDQAGRPTQALNQSWQHIEDTSKVQPIVATVNGKKHTIHGAHNKTLLRMLREDLQLTGSKEGCAEGECGACTVYMDGAAVMSCLVPAPRAHQSEITTVEGISQGDNLHPIQQSFIDEGAVQCGYCTPGLVMSGAKVLEECGEPTHWEAQQAIAGNLCRCTGYNKILTAIEKASQSE